MPQSLKESFTEYLIEKFPGLASSEPGNLIAEYLLSPFEIELPENLLTQAQEFVDAAFSLRELPPYQQKVLEKQAQLFPALSPIHDPGNKAIAMSYDFHVDDTGNLKLIEINTNASFLALGDEMYEFRKIKRPIEDFSPDEVKASVLKELQLHQKKKTGSDSHKALPKIAIVDEQPSQQRLYIEFLLYREWFRSWGWHTEIKDISENLNADFIYNRYTDFYLQDSKSALLKNIFEKSEACLSPNPYEYLMLADKERMIEWNEEGFLKSCGLSDNKIKILQRNLPKAKSLVRETADQIWTDRKHYFLKPLRAFGAKQSYRGGSISRKIFDEIVDQGFIAQEFVPAPERNFETPEGQTSFKFDLRFYAYQNRVQSVVARIYQGQVTNLRTTYGGFAPVKFL